jgi:hypothetical protein
MAWAEDEEEMGKSQAEMLSLRALELGGGIDV